MEKLNVLDRSFLRLESPRHPFHVAGLMLFKLPENAPKNAVRKLVKWAARLNTLWPILNKKLSHPEDLGKTGWVNEDNFRPERHVLHYALPQPGRMEDLLGLVSRAHERQLDLHRPLWEVHIIEGLPNNRFAIYCKVHHALLDGAAGMKMLNSLFSDSPAVHDSPPADLPTVKPELPRSMLRGLEEAGRGILEQYRAIPELSSLFTQLGLDALRGKQHGMKLPFTAPRSILNSETDSARRIILCDLPFPAVRKMGRKTGGSMNDVLLAVCGGALRRYLLEQDALPKKSLVAGLPVSIRRKEKADANQLSFILCPFFTDEADDLQRLQQVIKTTTEAKAKLATMSATAGQDFTNLIMMPTVVLTLAGATNVPPAINAIFSNVPGSADKLYLEGAELESIYPFSVVTDGMGINLTVVSYDRKLCFAITSCPTQQPRIEHFDKHLKASYKALRAAIQAS
ncbi:MAG: wax ester/triacylglycerol synthase family O-acyltransferase [Halioglobus sp.]|nr:wax ester/triacylglycerol synthase family O-acyltransferase [Halioglobus sp.]